MRPTTHLVLTIKALMTFLWLDFMLRVRGFQNAYDVVVRPDTTDAPPAGKLDTEDQHEVIDRTLSAVRSATRYYWRVRRDCLPKSLTLYILLRGQGVPARVCIGVQKYPFFAAHAWVEVGDRCLDDNPDQISKLAVLSKS